MEIEMEYELKLQYKCTYIPMIPLIQPTCVYIHTYNSLSHTYTYLLQVVIVIPQIFGDHKL